MKFDPNAAISDGSSAVKLFGKDLKIFLGDVELTGFIDGAELHQTDTSVGLTMMLHLPYDVAYQNKPKPYGYNKLKGAQATYAIQDEVEAFITEEFFAKAASKQLKPYTTKYPPESSESKVLDKIAREMVDKKKGIPHE